MLQMCRRILLVSWVIAAFLANGGAYRSWGNGVVSHGVPIEALLAGLRDENPESRAQAAKTLGIRQAKEAVEPLIALVGDEQERDVVKQAALEALGRIGDQRAVPPIIRGGTVARSDDAGRRSARSRAAS